MYKKKQNKNFKKDYNLSLKKKETKKIIKKKIILKKQISKLKLKSFDHFPTQKNLIIFRKNFIDILINKFTTNTERVILNILVEIQHGYLNKNSLDKLLKENSIIYEIIHIKEILKISNQKTFYSLISTNKNNPVWFLLNFIKKINKLKNSIDYYLKGFVTQEDLKRIFIENSNKKFLELEILNIKETKKINVTILQFSKVFSRDNIGFYNHLIEKYLKYNRQPVFRSKLPYNKLSLFAKKRHIRLLNYFKGNIKKNEIYKLALRYIGKIQTIPFARKRINKRYRSYRIFLYRFNLKPEALRKITRKNRKFKNGGTLITHISFYQFNISVLMLLANFCKTKDEVKKHIRDLTISVNGKIATNLSNIFKPYDIVHFIPEINKKAKSNFLKDLMAPESNNFVSKMNTKFFEYSFKVFCFIILPEFFSFFNITPPSFMSNSGRFSITKY